MALPSVSSLPAGILLSLDVPSPSNQDMEVVTIKEAVMKTLLPEELSEVVAMAILQLLVLSVFSTPLLSC